VIVGKDKVIESGNLTTRKLWFNLILFAVLSVIVLLLFHVFVFSDKMLYGSDTIQAGVFFRSFYVDYVHQHGAVPVWNPYQFCGIPYIDGFHGDTFYPFSVLKFVINIYRALGWNLILHVLLAGITMFACARAFGRSQMASALAAVSYMFAGYFISFVAPGHDGKIFVTALFPLAILLIELAFQRRPLLHFSLLGLVIGIIILTPHPQMAYYTLWACAFYFLFKLVFLYVEHKSVPALAKPTGLFVLAVIVGLAISGIQFYSGYTYVKNYSPRADEKRGMEWAQSWSLHWEEVVSLVVPEFSGVSEEKGNSYWGKNAFKDNSEYAGAVPLLMALVAIIMVRSRKTWFFAGLALFALIYALAGDTPFFYIFYYLIPNVKSTRAWSMIMFLFSFSIALLAAFGMDFIIEQSRRVKEQQRRALNVALFGLPALVLLGALAFAVAPRAAIGFYTGIFYSDMPAQKAMILSQHLNTITAGFWITFVFLAAAAAVAWLYSRRKASVLVLGIIIAVALIDAYRFDVKFVRTFDQQRAFSKNQLIDYFRSVPGQFRVLNLAPQYYLPTNYLPMFGIEEMTSYHGNQPRWYQSLLGGTGMRNMFNRNVIDMTNTRFILVSPGSPLNAGKLAADGFRPVYSWRDLEVLENPLATNRAYLVHKWVVEPNESGLEQMMLTRSFDPHTRVALAESPGIDSLAGADGVPGDTVIVDKYENAEISLRTRSQAPAVLVLSDNWYPSWKGFVDGREVPVLRANGAFRGVPLSAGDHTVEFRYISATQRTGRLLTIAGLVFVAVVVVAQVIPRRKQSGPQVEA
jgi:hypothetical protein